jgi:hypothetical protein
MTVHYRYEYAFQIDPLPDSEFIGFIAPIKKSE